MREIARWSSTNGAIPSFLVLPGSKLSITEITEYKFYWVQLFESIKA